MRPPEDIKEGGLCKETAQDQPPPRDLVRGIDYRQDSPGATFVTLRIISGAKFQPLVLQRAVDDVREHTETLPLWGFRLAQHVNRGTYGYQQAWNALERAAGDGGAREAWARRVLFRSFAKAVTSRVEVMPLRVLIGGLH